MYVKIMEVEFVETVIISHERDQPLEILPNIYVDFKFFNRSIVAKSLEECM